MSPEEQLILRCVHSIIMDVPLGEPPAVDWEQVFILSEINRLIPILYLTLPSDSLPDEWIIRLEQSARRRRMRVAVMIEEFQRIHAEFAIAGIQVIPIKGVALSQQIYPSPSMRYFDDLDLLVKTDAGPDALVVLEKLGYEPHPNVPRPDWHHLAPYIHRKRGTMVEIHVDLIRRAGQGWGINEIWNRSRPGVLGEITTRLLSNEDALIFSVLHARHNLFNRLSFMLDSVLLAARLDPASRSEAMVSELAKDAGAICALDYTIAQAGRLFALENLPEFGCSPARLWIANRIVHWNSLTPKNATLIHGPLPRILELLLMDSARDGMSMVARLAAPPRTFITAGSDDQRGRLRPYANRLFQKTRQAFRQLSQIIRGR
jgi:hypothetical protein